MFAAVDRGERVPDAGERMPRRFDDAFDLVAGGKRAHIVQNAGLPGLHGVAQARGAVALRRPANAGQRGARLADIEISDSHHVQP